MENKTNKERLIANNERLNSLITLIAQKRISSGVLPILANPATAADITLGKEAISANGEVITGTLEASGSGGDLMSSLFTTQSTSSPYDLPAGSLSGVKALANYAFYQKTGLRSLDTSEFTSIGSSAFYSCKSLIEFLGNNVKSLGTSAFYGCSSLTRAHFPIVTGSLSTCFQNCTSLVDVNLDSCPQFSQNVFSGCSSLEVISLPSLTNTGTAAFQGCSKLTTVLIPLVKQIGANTFQNCSSLVELTIPETCTSIAANALKCGSSTNKTTFIFKGTTPPTIQSSTFTVSNIEKIIVPVGCGDTYKAATNWVSFADYIEEATE